MTGSIMPEDRGLVPPGFYEPSNQYGFAQVVGTFAVLWTAMVSLGMVGVGAKVFVALVIGVLLYRLTFLLHECSHGTFFSIRWLNPMIGTVTAGFLAISFQSFRRNHFRHHRTYGTSVDPSASDYYGLTLSARRLAWHFIKALLLLTVMEKLRQLSGLWVGRGNERSLLSHAPAGFVRDAFVIVAMQIVAFLVASGWGQRPSDYLLGYLLPGLTVVPFLSRLRTYLEHGVLNSSPAEVRVARTTAAWSLGGEILAPLNFRFHHEHHTYPDVPARHLPRVHAMMVGSLPPSDYAHSFSSSLRALFLNDQPASIVHCNTNASSQKYRQFL